MADQFLTTEELRNLPDKDLKVELENARQNLNATRISIATTKEKAVHKSRQLKSQVARILTIMNERKHEEAKKALKAEEKTTDNKKE